MTQSIYHDHANKALTELDTEKADQLFLELVAKIEDAVNKNQKELAAELQRIAREIESAGKLEDSLRFKQRTCEVMLRRSMAERRRNAPPAPPPRDNKALTQMVFVCFASQPQAYAAFLQTGGLNKELRVLADGARWMRSKDSQLILVCKNDRLSGFFPLFIAASRDEASKELQSHGNILDGSELNVCGMKLLIMKDKSDQRFLLAGTEILQNI